MRTAVSITAISGFTEHEGSDYSNGIEALHEETLHPLMIESGGLMRAHYRPWNYEWEWHARAVWKYMRHAKTRKRRVAMFGYSYGGGYGVVKLAKELGKFGLQVNHIVLSDAVRHHGWPFWFMRRWPSAFSLSPCAKIRLPANCDKAEVSYWFQRNRYFSDVRSWPQGHRVYNSRGKLLRGVKVNAGMSHSNMDNYSGFRDRCRYVAGFLCREAERFGESSEELKQGRD